MHRMAPPKKQPKSYDVAELRRAIEDMEWALPKLRESFDEAAPHGDMLHGYLGAVLRAAKEMDSAKEGLSGVVTLIQRDLKWPDGTPAAYKKKKK